MSKSKHISLRVSESDYAKIQAAAKAAGRSMSEHLRRSATSSRARRVPELNREAWQELAPALSNLNQLSRNANRFAIALREHEFSSEMASQLKHLMRAVADLVEDLRAEVQSLRRELYGAAPLGLAIEVLKDWRRASNFGHLEVDRDRLGEVIEELGELREVLAEGDR